MTIISAYQNGNTKVAIYDDGTKVRWYEGEPCPEFPESIDVKITNYCDLECSYCHESSHAAGAHGDLAVLLDKLEELPPGIELAIGGGNPLSHPSLVPFLRELKRRNFIANITVNQTHLRGLRWLMLVTALINDNLVKGVGVSVEREPDIEHLKSIQTLSPHIVYHVIRGVHQADIITHLMQVKKNVKVLILGYKFHGRGASMLRFVSPHAWKEHTWKDFARKLLSGFETTPHLAFDNSAIEQLHIKKFVSKTVWDRLYMGEDSTFSMYIDAVERTYASTSYSSSRHRWEGFSIIEYFKTLRQRHRKTER